MDHRHYVLDNNGQILSIKSVNIWNRHNLFRCIACGDEMIPVLGKIREHHFRHKTDACSYESYIHKIWKQYLYEQWQTAKHFNIEYFVKLSCNKENTCKLKEENKSLVCNIPSASKTIDLKEKYDSCEIEGSYGGYRADLLFFNSKNPNIIPTFIEVCYKHPCNDEKIHAGIPIIEIIVHDDNLYLPSTLKEPQPPIQESSHTQQGNYNLVFYGFTRELTTIHRTTRFRVFQDEHGINHGYIDDTEVSCHSIDNHEPDSIIEIFLVDSANRQNNDLFEKGIRIAAKNGIKIRHCSLCRFYRSSSPQCLCKIKKDDRFWTFRINDLSNNEYDKTNHTYKCKGYQEWPYHNRIFTDDTPNIVWVNYLYERKQEYVPEDLHIKANISQARLSEIAIDHELF